MKKSKIILVLLIGIFIGTCITVSAVTIISASNVTYSNDKTDKTNVQDVLDDIIGTIDSGMGINPVPLAMDSGNDSAYASSGQGPVNLNYTATKDITVLVLQIGTRHNPDYGPVPNDLVTTGTILETSSMHAHTKSWSYIKTSIIKLSAGETIRWSQSAGTNYHSFTGIIYEVL